jgi:glycosyltransferase involved in cell wall biosynthesis
MQSILGQTSAEWELIVVDDGSTDETNATVERFADERIRYVYQSRAGVSSARNHGVQLARYSWIAFLDSDDLWQPRKLQRQLEMIEAHPSTTAVYTNEIWIRNGKRVNQKKRHRKYTGWIYHHCLPLCIISPSSVLLKRSLLDSVGVFDESLPVCEDYDLWLRITCRHPVCFLDENLIIKTGGHADQLSKSRWGLDRFRIRALEKIYHSGFLTPLQKLWTAREIVAKAEILSTGYRNRGKPSGAAKYDALARQHRSLL